MNFDEIKLKKIIQPYFETARSGDWNHTLRVVDWTKKLGQGRPDLNLLILAAYVHDIGWSGIAPKGKLDLDEMLKIENLANENSPRLVTEVLSKMNFAKYDIDIVKRLVRAADEHSSEKDDEAIIVDADNLSKLCIEHLEEKYQPDSYSKMVDLWKNVLADRIKTPFGKKMFPDLLLKLQRKVADKLR